MDEPTSAPTGGWCTAVVREVRHPNPDAVLLRLEVSGRTDHLPGQHYVFRLTAEDGYSASRSYSVASSPADPLLEFYVERLDDGEVSMYLADEVEPGDELELRGPIGGWFVWDGSRPAVGVAGGTGLVPLVAMLRHARDLGRPDLLSVVVSARTRGELPLRRRAARPDRAAHPRGARRTPGGPAGRGGPGTGARPDARRGGLRVRVGRLRGVGRRPAHGPRRARGPGARGAVRPDGLNARGPRPDDRTGPCGDRAAQPRLSAASVSLSVFEGRITASARSSSGR